MTVDPAAARAASNTPFFLQYQHEWLEDRSMIKIAEKSRRVGLTFAQAYEDVEDVLLKREYTKGRPVTRVYFSSADESAAREYIETCAFWAELFDAGAREMGEVVLDKDKDVKALCIEFKNGGKIYALTSNPKRFRSKGGKIVLDEFAFHKDQKGMWKAAKPAKTWGYPIRIISTHQGRQCFYYRCVEDARKGLPGWSLHSIPIQRAVDEGLVDKIVGHQTTEQERVDWLATEERDCKDPDIWQEEYCCNAIDATTAYFPYDLIAAAELDDVLRELDETTGDLYAGWDVARKKDLSVIWLAEKLGTVRYTRKVTEFHKTKFEIQMNFARMLLKHPRLRRMCIDQTGMGLPLAEKLSDEFSGKVEGVTFTGAVKEVLAVDAHNALEDLQARIPKDDVIRESFHSIKKQVTAAGNVRFDAESTDKTGHADHFWAFALCEHAAKTNEGPVTVVTRARRKMERVLKGFPWMRTDQ